MQPIIEAKSIYRQYFFNGHEAVVLKGLSCSFFKGEIISIMGASGVGKTTLIHLLSTLDRPTRGKVLLFGTDVSQLGPNELARLRNERLGFVFQMHHLLPEFSAIENACMPFLIQGASLKKVKGHAKKLFDLLDLSDRINSPVKLLSGGEQQRVAIIRAMVKQPDILFADEPTGNLDETATDKVADLFSLINREFGTTIVFVTHNPRLSRIATRTFLLSKGVLEEFRDE